MRIVCVGFLLLSLAACSERSEGEGGPAPDDGVRTPSAVLDDVTSEGEPSGPPTVAAPWRGSGDVIELSVWQMHCDGCAMEVEEALEAIDGVTDATAAYETSKVVVHLADAAKRDAVIALIRDAMHAQERFVVGEDEIPSDGG